ncbi:hypothetical protein CDAR_98641 [Caerostris darwini]|uniref:Uncharacterized protein n=1 Tax=Caerostris darwini TaxID=1538125 RepID=A0AAV4WVR2_9ARAC|nr:hypothetical protein CDAR_98641 [Caerostris darwini]
MRYLLGLGLGESELPRLPTSVTVLAVVLRLVGRARLLDWEVRVSAECEGPPSCWECLACWGRPARSWSSRGRLFLTYGLYHNNNQSCEMNGIILL